MSKQYTNIKYAGSKLMELAGRIVVTYAEMEHCMLLNIMLQRHITPDILEIAKYMPPTEEGFNNLQELFSNNNDITNFIFQEMNDYDKRFSVIYSDFKKVNKNKEGFKDLIRDIDVVKEFRDKLCHSKSATRRGSNHFKTMIKRKKDGSIKSFTCDFDFLNKKLASLRSINDRIMGRDIPRLSEEQVFESFMRWKGYVKIKPDGNSSEEEEE